MIPVTPDPPLSVTVVTGPSADVVTVAGDLDIYTVAGLRNVVFDPRLCVRPVLVLDVGAVRFIDSVGLAALVAARRWTVSRRAELRVVCAGGPCLRLVQISGLDSVLDLHDSVEAALAVCPV